MSARMTGSEIERTLRRAGVPKDKARAVAVLQAEANRTEHVLEAWQSAERFRGIVRRAEHVVEQLGGATGRRLGDRLVLTLPFPPRTKKNGGPGGFGGIRQRKAYRKYRDRIIAAIAPLTSALRLPLPEREYNIAALYYVDRGGEQADKCGLDQGLYDALQNAGVIGDDWYFRTDDGTRIIAGDAQPRVELTITPIIDSPLWDGSHV